MKLQKCFVDFETSPKFPPAWRWPDIEWLFVFGCPVLGLLVCRFCVTFWMEPHQLFTPVSSFCPWVSLPATFLIWYHNHISDTTNWCRHHLLTTTDNIWTSLNVPSSCVSVRAGFPLWSGLSAYRCLLFRLFSLGIPVREVLLARPREPLAPSSFIIVSSACRLSVKGHTPGRLPAAVWRP